MTLSAAIRLSFALLCPLALTTTACGDSVDPSDGVGGNGGNGGTGGDGGSAGEGGDGGCDSTLGTLQGNIYLFAAPGEPDSAVEPGMLVTLSLPTPSEPIFVMADDEGHYEVDIEAQTWLVGGQDAEAGCFAEMAATVELPACGTVTQDVVLNLCIGG